jgi:hypothetical protein
MSCKFHHPLDKVQGALQAGMQGGLGMGYPGPGMAGGENGQARPLMLTAGQSTPVTNQALLHERAAPMSTVGDWVLGSPNIGALSERAADLAWSMRGSCDGTLCCCRVWQHGRLRVWGASPAHRPEPAVAARPRAVLVLLEDWWVMPL